MSKERKIELLNKMINVMDDTGKEKIPAFDIDSRSMHTKKKVMKNHHITCN